MRTNTIMKKLLRIENIAIENMYFEPMNKEEIFIVRMHPFKRETMRCPKCGKYCSGYDSRTRRWRSLDFGSNRVYFESNATRVKCPEHGVIVARVPWARHDSDYTYDFETAITWSALHMTATAVSEFFRIDWHTVGSICKRVQKSMESLQPSRFDNLEEIGIDETSYKKGHKYMTVVINHKTGALIWAKKGHGKEILTSFFEELTFTQRESIKLVSADGASWIAECIKDYCPKAQRCVDPFHVVMWAMDALDEIRKQVVREARTDVVEGKTVQGGKKNNQRNS